MIPYPYKMPLKQGNYPYKDRIYDATDEFIANCDSGELAAFFVECVNSAQKSDYSPEYLAEQDKLHGSDIKWPP